MPKEKYFVSDGSEEDDDDNDDDDDDCDYSYKRYNLKAVRKKRTSKRAQVPYTLCTPNYSFTDELKEKKRERPFDKTSSLEVQSDNREETSFIKNAHVVLTRLSTTDVNKLSTYSSSMTNRSVMNNNNNLGNKKRVSLNNNYISPSEELKKSAVFKDPESVSFSENVTHSKILPTPVSSSSVTSTFKQPGNVKQSLKLTSSNNCKIVNNTSKTVKQSLKSSSLSSEPLRENNLIKKPSTVSKIKGCYDVGNSKHLKNNVETQNNLKRIRNNGSVIINNEEIESTEKCTLLKQVFSPKNVTPGKNGKTVNKKLEAYGKNMLLGGRGPEFQPFDKNTMELKSKVLGKVKQQDFTGSKQQKLSPESDDEDALSLFAYTDILTDIYQTDTVKNLSLFGTCTRTNNNNKTAEITEDLYKNKQSIVNYGYHSHTDIEIKDEEYCIDVKRCSPPNSLVSHHNKNGTYRESDVNFQKELNSDKRRLFNCDPKVDKRKKDNPAKNYDTGSIQMGQKPSRDLSHSDYRVSESNNCNYLIDKNYIHNEINHNDEVRCKNSAFIQPVTQYSSLNVKNTEIVEQYEQLAKENLFNNVCDYYLKYGTCRNKMNCLANHFISNDVYLKALKHQNQEVVSKIFIKLLDHIATPPRQLFEVILNYYVEKKDLSSIMKLVRVVTYQDRNQQKLNYYWSSVIRKLREIFQFTNADAVSYILKHVYLDPNFDHVVVNTFLNSCIYCQYIDSQNMWNCVKVLVEKPNYYLPLNMVKAILIECINSSLVDCKKYEDVLDAINKTLPRNKKEHLCSEICELQVKIKEQKIKNTKNNDIYCQYQEDNLNSMILLQSVEHCSEYNDDDVDGDCDDDNNTVLYNSTRSPYHVPITTQGSTSKTPVKSIVLSRDQSISKSDFTNGEYLNIFEQWITEKSLSGVLEVIQSIPDKIYFYILGEKYTQCTNNDDCFCLDLLQYYKDHGNKLSKQLLVNWFIAYITWFVIFKNITDCKWTVAYTLYKNMKNNCIQYLNPELNIKHEGTNFTPARRVIAIAEICMNNDHFSEVFQVLENSLMFCDKSLWKGLVFVPADVKMRNRFCNHLMKVITEHTSDLSDSCDGRNVSPESKKFVDYALQLFKRIIFSNNANNVLQFHRNFIKEYLQLLMERLLDHEMFSEAYNIFKRTSELYSDVTLNLLSHEVYRVITLILITTEFEKNNHYKNKLLEEIFLIGVYPTYKVTDKCIQIQSIWLAGEVYHILKTHLLLLIKEIKENNYIFTDSFCIQIEETRMPSHSPLVLRQNHVNTVQNTVEEIKRLLGRFDPPINVERYSENPRLLKLKREDLLRHLHTNVYR
ncbi:uncharacterized protein LOC142325305 isoform X2 [Lycorma delicatula]|uniref:uncharacterized protein LOC142325305 isoform X2 n=1 Tax=Lycorma delicatula TaxID=130591 RepID=UPI003F51546B